MNVQLKIVHVTMKQLFKIKIRIESKINILFCINKTAPTITLIKQCQYLIGMIDTYCSKMQYYYESILNKILGN